MSTKTTAEMSPLSALAGVGTGAMGLFQGTGSAGTGPSLFDNIKKALGTGAAGTTFDLGGGLKINADGSISGGSVNVDSGLSNDDIYAQTLGYDNYADFLGQGGDFSTNPVDDEYYDI